ncbi:MAG: hypothetical protein KDC90_08915 [Ignavibacteriae bacterium]|nr:hypothetical protein [Ignavibacteriota bacterium]
MKIGNKDIKQFSAIFFLAIFSSFLSVSFFHSHNFNYRFNSDHSISEESGNHTHDILLDSSYNCTIHTFNNNIQFQDSFKFSEVINDIEIIFKYSYHFYFSNNNLTTKQLRAPPTHIV